MAEFNVVATEDEGFFRVNGLTSPLKSTDVIFSCDMQPTDTDDQKSTKMMQALFELRSMSHNVADGDVFTTQNGKFIVRGTLVVPYTDAQAQVISQQHTVATPNHIPTLGQLAAQHGVQLPSALQPLANTPISQISPNISAPPAMQQAIAQAVAAANPPPQTQQAANPAPLNSGVANGGQPRTLGGTRGSYNAYDSNGGHVTGVFTSYNPSTTTNQDLVEEFDNSYSFSLGSNGNLEKAIAFPNTSRRVLEISYSGGAIKVVLEVM